MAEKSIRVIVKCWTPEWYDAVTHAVIEFDLTMLGDLWGKHKIADNMMVGLATMGESRLPILPDRLMGLQFDRCDPDFINVGDPADIGMTEEEFEALDDGWQVLPAKVKLDPVGMRPVSMMVMAGDLDEARTGVRKNSGRIYWAGYDKHGDAGCRAETYSLYPNDLEEIGVLLQ